MPSSRSSSLSRSNIRLNASNESGYPGTAARIWPAVRYRREESRQTTRLSSRSVFCLDIVHPSAHTAGSRHRRYRAQASTRWIVHTFGARRVSVLTGGEGEIVIKWRSGKVTAVRREWRGAVELEVTIAGVLVRALAYPDLTGRPEPGDRVLVNTGALDLGLGTGGYALVVAIPDRLPADPQGPGHLVKARYTPMQATVLGVDEQSSAYHEMLRDADSLEGIPVVIADLHSALPAVLAAFRSEKLAPAGPGRQPAQGDKFR